MAFESECVNMRKTVFGQQMRNICGTLACVYSVPLIFNSGIISVSIWCFYRTCVILDNFHSHRNDTSEQWDLLVRCGKSVLKVPQCCLVFQAVS